MAEYIQGVRSYDNIPSDARLEDWQEQIIRHYADLYPFTAITSRIKRKVSRDAAFHIFERGLQPLRTAIDHTGGYDDAATDLDVDAGTAYLFRKNHIVRVGDAGASGELLLVVSNPTTGDTIEVARGKFGTSPATIPEDANLTIQGTVFADGTLSAQPYWQEPEKIDNYTQIFKHTYKVTGRAEGTDTRFGEPEQVRLKRQALEQHMLEREMAFLYGLPYEETDSESGTKRTTTGGIAQFVPAANKHDGSGSNFTKANFWDWVIPLSDYGADQKLVFCGGTAWEALHDLVEGNTQMTISPLETVYGLKLRRIQTPGPDLLLKKHSLLTKYYPGDLVIIDLPLLTLRFMRDSKGNRSLRFEPNIQPNDADYRMGQFLSDEGLQMGIAAAHGYIYGVSAYTPPA